jgi:hypothetical protein
MDNKRKHLEFIQTAINRMAGNLFFLKGWAITLISALFALSAKDSKPEYVLISFFIIFIFWILDGYFLSQERLFRALYNDVRKLKEEEIDFSMDISKYRVYCKNTWINSMGSVTLLWFYPPLIIIMLIVIFLTR